MWLTYIALPLIVLAIIASVAGGGIFTIILVPLAIIAIVAAVWSGASARAAGAEPTTRRGSHGAGPGGTALPTSPPRSSGRVQSSPEGLADARREQQ
jgi:uncharacterized protein (DUF58 family)